MYLSCAYNALIFHCAIFLNTGTCWEFVNELYLHKYPGTKDA